MKSDALKVILDATGQAKQGAGEDAQTFLARLHKAISGLPDKGWDALGRSSKAAQKWYNDSSVKRDNKEDFIMLDGVKEKGGTEDAGERKSTKSKKATKTAKAQKPAKTAKAAKGKTTKPAKKAKSNGAGRPRMADDAVLVRKVKKLPEGNRNKFWDKIPAGTSVAKIRKSKAHLRVVRYWRRNGFVELRAP